MFLMLLNPLPFEQYHRIHSAIIFSNKEPSSCFTCSFKSVLLSSAKLLKGTNKKRIVNTITILLNIFFKLLPPIKGKKLFYRKYSILSKYKLFFIVSNYKFYSCYTIIKAYNTFTGICSY